MTKKYQGHDGIKHYIIGIAAGEFEFKGSFYARFIKSSYAFDIIQDMVRKLGCCENESDQESDSDINIDKGFNINNIFNSFSDIDKDCVHSGVTRNVMDVSYEHRKLRKKNPFNYKGYPQ